MSEEQLKAFIAKVQADPSLQEQLKAEGADVVAIAKEEGFSISADDLKNAQSKLSEQELEGVAGGAVTIGRCGAGPVTKSPENLCTVIFTAVAICGD